LDRPIVDPLKVFEHDLLGDDPSLNVPLVVTREQKLPIVRGRQGPDSEVVDLTKIFGHLLPINVNLFQAPRDVCNEKALLVSFDLKRPDLIAVHQIAKVLHNFFVGD
jgi:hypothetical protein